MTVTQVVAALTSLFTWYFFSDTASDPEGYVRDKNVILSEYDFIIIGAGSAGAVIANRLTEISEWNVLLLEAGGDESFSSQIPGLAAAIQLTKKDWQYKVVPQDNACLMLPDRRCLWPRGKMLGGSSSLNYMLYVRGNRRDYDNWGKTLGNTGWSYDDVLPYFLKSEDNQNPYLAGTKYHGKGGYLTVSEPGYHTPLGTAFIQGGVEMGYENRDFNGEFQTGFMFAQGTIRRGSRCSTSKAFLRPVRNRPNLHISMNSRVHKILIDSTTKEATGVQFEKNGRIFNIKASKEVVLSAGSIASPQILMLSGVGPADHLKEKGINVLADLPVGDNLHDHVAIGGIMILTDKPFTVLGPRLISLPVLLNYTLYGGTPLSLFGGVEGLAWIKSKYADQNDDWPDIQYHFGPGSEVSDDGLAVRYAHGVPDDIWEKYYKPVSNRDAWTILPANVKPLSRGTIRLNSTDPYDHPLINPNYYKEPRDLEIAVEAIKSVVALTKTEAFQKIGSKFYDKPFPPCENIPLWTNAYWECYIKSYCLTLAHTVGTCKMGPDSDTKAVVDPQLRVRGGIKKLRVADTSIMPVVPNGNTNAPTIMVGEKASDLIKQSWGKL